MDTTTIFYNLLKSIEDSNLNYALNKTPFSAGISIKSLFIKRLSCVESEVVRKEVNGNNSEAKIVILEQENLKLKERLWNYEQEQKVDNIEKDL